jgi:hypothetical protein
MAKHNPPSHQRSKVRLFFVDADLAPGDLEELTAALTTAIRPTHVIARTSGAPRLAIPAASNGEAVIEEMEEVESLALDEPVEEAPTDRTSSRKRSYRKPVPVNLDMRSGGKAFEEFAREKGPADQRARYLVAAAWLHDFAKVSVISADHVFTCYKSAGWTFDIKDPGLPLRKLKAEGLGTTKDGLFSINHLGLAEVEKMKPAV